MQIKSAQNALFIVYWSCAPLESAHLARFAVYKRVSYKPYKRDAVTINLTLPLVPWWV